ncbi:MAG TPA: amino acid ABC transporter permease [Actinomycetes bacterium]|nr:amino acid ABC transporter permease [Actinomycetes bacterium]
MTLVTDPARETVIRKKRRRDLLIASLSTVVVFGAAVVVILQSPGWPAVKESFLNPVDARRAFPSLVDGFWLTLKLFLTAEPVVLLVALLIAVLRGLTAPILAPLRIVATLYTDIVRGIPTILLIFLFGFGIPALNLQGVTNEPLFWGWAALVVSYSAYVSEVFRAGLESVHPSQAAAARALGLNRYQGLRHVVLPQATRRVIPPLLNDFISLQKDTALVSFLGPIELMSAAAIYANSKFNYTPYIVASLFFILLTVPMTRYADWIAARQRQRSQSSGAGL